MSGPLFEAKIRRRAEDFGLTGERITRGITGLRQPSFCKICGCTSPLGGIRSAHCKHVTPDIATCMYYTGIDPFTKQQVHVARNLRDRKKQWALMQFFKPENWFTVREALIQAGRQDLIGSGCDYLIPARAPKEAIEARRQRANRVVNENYDHYHTVSNHAKSEGPGEGGTKPIKPTGYRPGRKTQKRRQEKRYKKPGL